MTWVKTTTNVNIRLGPGTDYDVLGQLPEDYTVEVAGEIDNGFRPVILWVSDQYLVEVADEEETPTPVVAGAVTGKMVVAKAMTQSGDPYVYGYEVDLDDPNPAKFDCSELVQWVCHQLKITPVMPDGSSAQREFCYSHDTIIPIEQAVKTAGALLFGNGHVAISRGDGTTIEARGAAYGVGSWTSKNRPWGAAGLIPGVKYA